MKTDNVINENKIAHRKGIWSVETYGHECITIKSTEPDYDGIKRSILTMNHYDEGQKTMNKANAAFICKAVNNYDSLLSALKDMMFLVSTSERYFTEEWENKIIAAKEAIKKC